MCGQQSTRLAKAKRKFFTWRQSIDVALGACVANQPVRPARHHPEVGDDKSVNVRDTVRGLVASTVHAVRSWEPL